METIKGLGPPVITFFRPRSWRLVAVNNDELKVFVPNFYFITLIFILLRFCVRNSKVTTFKYQKSDVFYNLGWSKLAKISYFKLTLWSYLLQLSLNLITRHNYIRIQSWTIITGSWRYRLVAGLDLMNI